MFKLKEKKMSNKEWDLISYNQSVVTNSEIDKTTKSVSSEDETTISEEKDDDAGDNDD